MKQRLIRLWWKIVDIFMVVALFTVILGLIALGMWWDKVRFIH